MLSHVEDASDMNTMNTGSLARLWSEVQASIRPRFQPYVYDNFIDNTELVSLDGSTATIVAPSPTNVMILNTPAYHELLKNALAEVSQTSYALKIVDKNSYRIVTAPVITTSPTITSNKFFHDSKIDTKLTFSNFVRGDSNADALRAAIFAAENPGTSNPIFLYSATGCGKTHLLQAIANAYLEKRPNAHILYTDTEQFTSEFINVSRGIYDSNEFRAFFDSIDMLLIDDIQFLAGREKTSEYFFSIFNRFVSEGKQIVITSDRHPSELADIPDRLVSRFSASLALSISKPDSHTMRSILDMKLKELGLTDLLSEESKTYLVTHNPGNIRAMYGDLNRLTFTSINSSHDSHPLSLTEVEDAFGDRKGRGAAEKDPLSAQKIIKEVAEHYRISEAQILSKVRTAKIATPRKIAMYLCKDMLSMPYVQIGKTFSRDHSTVMKNCSTIKSQLKSDSLLASNVSDLKKKLMKKTVETAIES